MPAADPPPTADSGYILCACRGVSREAVAGIIDRHACTDPHGVTTRLGAGGGCGACLPEIRMLIAMVATRRPGGR